MTEARQNEHWSDDEVIAHLYGLRPDATHLQMCELCRSRVSEAQSNRKVFETEPDVPFEFLAAQRRSIYSKLTAAAPWWAMARIQKWASLCASVLVLGGGIFLYEQNRTPRPESQITDAQLAQEVSQFAQDSEPEPTAPLQALFE